VAYTSEIEKLEARYRENPKGRNFAPLADAYRKAGLVDNAIDLCRAGLELHPDYVSGHIVLGRCLVDKKDDAGADGVFRRVLELDPENILSLKVLAEIAERNERFDVAGQWFDRLLMADPMNGEAAEGLTRVRGKASAQVAQPEAAPAEPPATALMEEAAETPVEVVHEDAPAVEEVAAATEPSSGPGELDLERLEGPFADSLADAPTAAMSRPDFEVERTSEPVSPPAGGELEVFDGTVDFASVEQVATPPEGIQLDEPEVAEPETEVAVEGLARTQYEGSGLFSVEAEPPPHDEPLAVEMVEAPTPEPEQESERATSPMSDLPLIMPEDLEPEPEPVAAMQAAPPIPQLPDDDGAADTETLSQAEPVVTETMAELYLHQGHREDARRVYAALSAQRPHDVRLQRKVAELSGEAPPRSGQSAGAFLKSILQARPGAPAPHFAPGPDVAPLEEAGPNGAEPAAPAPGSPTRPASDAISLDSVFGEESGRGAAPAASDAAPQKPVRLPAASGGFSFDDFFGTSTGPGPAPSDNVGARAPRHSGRGRGAEQEEDLDQFQAWLKSLKA
jgi:tetratricopeptide (TPR) repeat protein